MNVTNSSTNTGDILSSHDIHFATECNCKKVLLVHSTSAINRKILCYTSQAKLFFNIYLTRQHAPCLAVSITQYSECHNNISALFPFTHIDIKRHTSSQDKTGATPFVSSEEYAARLAKYLACSELKQQFTEDKVQKNH